MFRLSSLRTAVLRPGRSWRPAVMMAVTMAVLSSLLLAGCGGTTGASTDYGVSGSVSGLAAPGLQLSLNDGTPLTIDADGRFQFPSRVQGEYQVVVTAQPTGQVCTVSNGSGDAAGTEVSDVRVVCAAQTFAVGGTLEGLAEGASVVVKNNGADALTLRADGAFRFATPVAYDGGYSVTVGTQPAGQTCSVSAGAGDGVTAEVSTPRVQCSDRRFQVSGQVRGLSPGAHVTLKNNGGDATVVLANGPFRFAGPVAWHGSYAVTVGTQPTGAVCTVSKGRGHAIEGDVDGVAVTCSAQRHAIGGTVTGLSPGAQVTLHNNGADPVTVTTDGRFSFPTPVAHDGGYAVTVSTDPVGQVCSVAHASGAGVTADVTDVAVTCSALSYRVGGSVSGLAGGTQVTLQNNGGDYKTVTADGSFVFDTPVAYGGAYAVAVATQPAGAYCSVSQAAGTMAAAAVTNVTVTCGAAPISWLYSASFNNAGLLGYSIHRGTGAMAALPSAPYMAGSGSLTTTVHPNGQFLYAPDYYDGSLRPYAIDGGTGALTAVPGGVVSGDPGAALLTFTPDGRFAYVTGALTDKVYGYAVDPGTGLLTPVPGVSVATGGVPYGMAVSADGAALYVGNWSGNTVSAYLIDGTTGDLTPMAGSPYAVNAAPWSLTVHPSGEYLYVASRSTGLEVFRIDATTHQLSNAQPGGVATPVGGEQWAFVVDGTGRYGYLATAAGVFTYPINPATGQLGAGQLGHAMQAFATTANAAGTRLYVRDAQTGEIAMLEIDAGTGALTPVPGGPRTSPAFSFNLSVIEH